MVTLVKRRISQACKNQSKAGISVDTSINTSIKNSINTSINTSINASLNTPFNANSIIGNFAVVGGELWIIRVRANMGSVDFDEGIIRPDNYFAKRDGLKGMVYYDLIKNQFVVQKNGHQLSRKLEAELIDKFELKEGFRYE